MKKNQPSPWLCVRAQRARALCALALLGALALGGCKGRQTPEAPFPAAPAPAVEEEKPAENLGPSWGAKATAQLLGRYYPQIDDWELLFDESALWEEEGQEPKIQGCSLLATEEGAGFDRLLVYTLGPVNEEKPEEAELLLAVEGKEAAWQLGKGEAIRLSYSAAQPWYPNLWLPEEGRALLLDSVNVKLLPLRCEEEPPALFLSQTLGEFWPQEGLKDSLLYVLMREEVDHTLWRLYYYDTESQEAKLLTEQSQGFLQTYPVDNKILACLGPEKVSFYDMGAEEPWEAFASLGDGAQAFHHFLWTDRDYPQRHLLCYADENQDLHLLLVNSQGQVLEDFPLGLSEGQNLYGTFASGLFYFAYYPKEDALPLDKFPLDAGDIYHFVVDVRPDRNHSLQHWQR